MAEELQHGEGTDEIEQAIRQPDVQELRTPSQEADDRKQHNGERAHGVACEYAVENRWPLNRTCNYEGKSNKNGGSGGNEHHTVPSNSLTRRSIPPASRSSAPSLTRAWTVSSLPLAPTVIVPGVSVIEFA